MRKTVTGTGGMLLLQILKDGLAGSQGVDGECVTTLKELEPALRRGVERITRDNRPYLVAVAVAREGVGADSTWYQDWQL
jgi:hypothetical protein